MDNVCHKFLFLTVAIRNGLYLDYTNSLTFSTSSLHHAHFFLSRVFPRYITILSPEDPTRNVAGKPEDGVDLRTLRAIRVLRPLKLVSGVPSKCMIQTQLNLSSKISIIPVFS